MRSAWVTLLLVAVAAEVRAQDWCADAVWGVCIECAASGDTYLPGGDHLATQHQVGTDTNGDGVTENAVGIVPWYFRQATTHTSAITSSAAHDAIERAFLAWTNAQHCDNDWPDLYFAYDSANNFASTSPPELLNAPYPAYGIVRTSASASDWSQLPDVLAVTARNYVISTGYTVNFDMLFNDYQYDWRAKPNSSSQYVGCTNGSADCYDYEVVATHEAGHALGLEHVACTEAVMYPTAQPTQDGSALTEHEKAGVCAIYPARTLTSACYAAEGFTAATSDCAAIGEQCTANTQCNDGGNDAWCVSDPSLTDYSFCSLKCDAQSDCPEGWACSLFFSSASADVPDYDNNGSGDYFCRPYAKPDSAAPFALTFSADDMCEPCGSGADCESGLCVSDDESDTGICTVACLTSCPDDFTCTGLQGVQARACLPDDATLCGSTETTGGEVNEDCFAGDVDDNSTWSYEPCQTGLTCFAFRPDCGWTRGSCLNQCDSSNACPAGLTCCYYVDDDGWCETTPPATDAYGACLNIRQEGESCESAENSVCEEGLINIKFQGFTSACFRRCDNGESDCGAGATCQSYGSACGGSYNLCCDVDEFDESGDCVPGEESTVLEVGVECDNNADCDSGLCLKLDGDTACSRECNVATGVGCPANQDVNGDGEEDEIECRLIDGEGKCWPSDGPLATATTTSKTTRTSDSGGCCSAVPMGHSDLLANLLPWLPLVWRFRRRH